ncbi:MAG TPA: 2-phospho-L-lactate transferase [Actinomycetota bacterium]
MRVTALAGGVGAGKFLRGLVRVVPEEDVTVVVNTGDDITVHGLHVSPDLDSVTYWLGGVADRVRGWGRDGESFRATKELRALGAEGAWFGLGDLDLATHLFRTRLLAEGRTLSEATREVTSRFGIGARVLPMTDDSVTTRVEVVDEAGRSLDLHFQEYWVLRGARDEVKSVRFEGAERARPAPGILEAIATAEAVVFCPSNPIVSIDPILAVPGVREAVAARRDRVVAISPIVGGAPLRGMADRLLPVAGVDVSAAGVAEHYGGLLGAFVFDHADRDLIDRILASCDQGRVADTIMVDDAAAERLAREALEVAGGPRVD